MSNTHSLLPCPFCGESAEVENDFMKTFWVQCDGEQHTDGMLYKTPAEAVAAWNRRTPQPANLGFTIENRAGADVLVWKEGGCRPATSAEVAMWKALAAVQQPVVREPLTHEQLWANDEIMSLNADLGWHMDTIRMLTRAIERAHGITQKVGSNA